MGQRDEAPLVPPYRLCSPNKAIVLIKDELNALCATETPEHDCYPDFVPKPFGDSLHPRRLRKFWV